MKLLTSNFLTCALKTCKSSPQSFPLHFRDAELEQTEMEYNPLFLKNILPRLEWDALRTVAEELGFTNLPSQKPEFPTPPSAGISTQEETREASGDEAMDTSSPPDVTARGEGEEEEAVLRHLHTVLLETHVMEGKLVCGNCGHEYRIKEGIANFLLPGHLV
ncbi:hypothetical protein MMC10_000399 [Thelotrema lepadinum]|nr:hypothetical protein [Thelotrema lepadinum]